MTNKYFKRSGSFMSKFMVSTCTLNWVFMFRMVFKSSHADECKHLLTIFTIRILIFIKLTITYSYLFVTYVKFMPMSERSYLVLSRGVPHITLTYPLNRISCAANEANPSFTVNVTLSCPWEYKCGTPQVAVGVCNPSPLSSIHVRAGTVTSTCTSLQTSFNWVCRHLSASLFLA